MTVRRRTHQRGEGQAPGNRGCFTTESTEHTESGTRSDWLIPRPAPQPSVSSVSSVVNRYQSVLSEGKGSGRSGTGYEYDDGGGYEYEIIGIRVAAPRTRPRKDFGTHRSPPPVFFAFLAPSRETLLSKCSRTRSGEPGLLFHHREHRAHRVGNPRDRLIPRPALQPSVSSVSPVVNRYQSVLSEGTGSGRFWDRVRVR